MAPVSMGPLLSSVTAKFLKIFTAIHISMPRVMTHRSPIDPAMYMFRLVTSHILCHASSQNESRTADANRVLTS